MSLFLSFISNNLKYTHSQSSCSIIRGINGQLIGGLIMLFSVLIDLSPHAELFPHASLNSRLCARFGGVIL